MTAIEATPAGSATAASGTDDTSLAPYSRTRSHAAARMHASSPTTAAMAMAKPVCAKGRSVVTVSQLTRAASTTLTGAPIVTSAALSA